MAKKNQVFIDVVIDDKGTTKRVAVNAKQLGIELEKTGVGADKAAKGTDQLNKNSQTLNRNLKGTGKQSSNTTKNFSKMQQGMGGLVGAYATLAAQIFAVSAAFQFLQSAAQLKNLTAGQEALGAATGTAYKTITSSVIEATEAQLGFLEASQAVSIGTAAGLTASQLTDLATAAKNTSAALGRDLTDSFNRLIRGVTKAEPELLDELGIILRLDTATRKYAQAVGQSVGDLTAWQRTQAVANDVLEQAESKFGMMEALMDQDALALNQFARSFDELVNSLKEGVLEKLAPIFRFLTDNTMGLVAALSLVALPIIKGIIPSMDEWQASSKKKAKQSKRAAKDYGKQIDEQVEALRRLNMAEEEAAAIAQATADRKGTARGADVDFMTGTGGSQQAAADTLRDAEAQMKKHGEIRRGVLQGYNKTELQDMRRSYDMRVAAAVGANKKIQAIHSETTIKFKKNVLIMKREWALFTSWMAKTARKTAGVIDKAFSAMAWIGMISLLISAGQSLWEYLFPKPAQQKAAEDAIESLTDKYEQLAGEMQNAANVRKNMAVGGQGAVIEGKQLASLDPKDFIEQIDRLQGFKDMDGVTKLQEGMLEVMNAAAEINPKFKQLEGNIKNFAGPVSRELKTSLIESSAETIDLGQRIDQLPQSLSRADKAYTTMIQSMIKPTGAETLITQEAKNIETLEQNLIEATKARKTRSNEILEMGLIENQFYKEQQAIVEKIKKDPAAFGKDDARDQLLAATSLGEISYHNYKTILMGLGIEKKITREQYNQVAGREAVIEQLWKSLDAEEAVEDLLKGREGRLSNIAEWHTKLKGLILQRGIDEEKSIRSQTLGLTITGKLVNLRHQEFNLGKRLWKAEDKHEQALAILRDAKVKAGSEEAQLKDENVIAAQRAVNEAKNELDVQKALKDVAQAKLDFQRAQLDLQKEYLGQLAAEKNEVAAIARARSAAAHKSKMGGGTFASAGAQRQSNIELLGRQEIVDQGQVAMATRYFNEAVARRVKELSESVGKEGGLPAGTTMADITQRATFSTTMGKEGTELNTAKSRLQTTQQDLDYNKNMFSVITSQNEATREQLEMRAKSSFMNREEQLFLDLKIAAMEQFGPLNEAQEASLKAQAKAQNDLNMVIEAKQAIGESITSNLESAFNSIVDGSKSAKEAFRDMAKAILADIAKMIVKLLIQKAIMAAMGMADGGVTPDNQSPSQAMLGGGAWAKNGGVFGPRGKNYTSGDIARGPTQGYPATLHGNEAVVPLPHNRKIPVELMGGAGGQQNNVSVTVNMGATAGNGGSQQQGQGDSQAANQLGDAVAKAVQAELQNQKRSGGILNPYGVA